ncbi:MAG: sigma 54-interacting transcriptional regulator, partial [Firmicutes bacterium]|nr:sigma 54-interacting transcriptional regulator [Bacillota bacterium]
ETPVHEAMQHLVGDSLPMQMTKTRIHQISKSDASVLLFGATGTGKGVAARAIHQMSNRASRPFIEQNCAAIPANLLESLFFGTVKGSYTGATDTEGIFRQCNGGTLFLDEINSMDLNLQAKLLKVLESG